MVYVCKKGIMHNSLIINQLGFWGILTSYYDFLLSITHTIPQSEKRRFSYILSKINLSTFGNLKLFYYI